MSGNDRDDDGPGSFFRRGNSTDVNSRILFIAIIVLSTVVVVVTMLHFYARYMLRRHARRREALQGIGVIARIHSDEPLRRGLKPDVIASLPILMYKNNDHVQEQDNSRVTECAVCLGSFEDGQMIRTLPSCKHDFHAECIDKWFESQSSCPICRHEVELVGPTLSPLPREPSTRLGVEVGPPSAPPLEHTVSVKEGTSDGMVQSSSSKFNGSNSRLGSFRRMLSMDKSSRRNNSASQDGIEDIERQ